MLHYSTIYLYPPFDLCQFDNESVTVMLNVCGTIKYIGVIMKHLIFIMSYPMSPGWNLNFLILFNITISDITASAHSV